jgi:hypothetical protein
MMRNLAVGIDIGTYQIKVVVAESVKENGKTTTKILGTGSAESKGLRHGYIINGEDVTSNLRMNISTVLTSDSNLFYVGGGLHFYFMPLSGLPQNYGDNTRIFQMRKHSAYVGGEIGISRVQLLLDRISGESADVVTGALVGPSLRAGYIRSYTERFSLHIDFFYNYGFSQRVAVNTMGLSFGLIGILP